VADLNKQKPDLIAIPLFADYRKYVAPAIAQPIDALVASDYSYEGCMYGYAIYRLK
jgi:hypothetical protein